MDRGPNGVEPGDGRAGTREYFQTLRVARNEYAPWMARQLGYAPGFQDVAGLNLLDVDCGSGIDLAGYAAAGALVLGVDLTPRHVELARQHLAVMGLDGRVLQGDAEYLPFADKSFDRVTSNGLLHHTPDLRTALRELLRVLRPGGERRMTVYNKRSCTTGSTRSFTRESSSARCSRTDRWQMCCRATSSSTRPGRPLVRVYNPARVRRELRRAGFTDVAASFAGFKHDDAFPVDMLSVPFPRLKDHRVADRIGPRSRVVRDLAVGGARLRASLRVCSVPRPKAA